MRASVSHQQNDTERAAFDRENGVQRLKEVAGGSDANSHDA